MDKYQEYIIDLKMTYEKAYGKCEEYSKQMKEKFPELILTKGHYECAIWGSREHWWLQTKGGQIIDPTKMQFPSYGICEYIPWNKGDPIPTGKCPQCGEYTWNHESVHKECVDAYVAYCNHP